MKVLFLVLVAVACCFAQSSCWQCQTLWACRNSSDYQCSELMQATISIINENTNWTMNHPNGESFSAQVQIGNHPSSTWDVMMKFMADPIYHHCNIFASAEEISGHCYDDEAINGVLNPVLGELSEYDCDLIRRFGCGSGM
eukprot:TRINITY_DN129_c0_g1_i1.p1 TRINITY_DN129_c0_g1~~TRINITY_DN129_c0_g1_i1.p1  ORF type:complete len:141 (+),score=21.39 TRINITY_DN129_c0_g1_i1:82-504(+)